MGASWDRPPRNELVHFDAREVFAAAAAARFAHRYQVRRPGCCVSPASGSGGRPGGVPGQTPRGRAPWGQGGAVARRDGRPRRRLPEGSAALATRQRPQRFRFTQRASFCRRSILGPPRHLTGPPGARVLPGRRPRGLRPPERRSRPAAACPSPRRPPSGILIAPSGLSSSSQKCHRVPGRARNHRHCQITFRRRQEPFTPHGEAKADGLRGAGQ